MAKILVFEDLVVWQKSQDLAVEIFEKFENNKNFSFKDQISIGSSGNSKNDEQFNKIY